MEREKTIAHEKKHQEDMQNGDLDYDDDSITYMGTKYQRKDGKILYDGEWLEEGDKSFPWEQAAYAVEPTDEELSPLKQNGDDKPKPGSPEWDAVVQEGIDFQKDWYSDPTTSKLLEEQAPRYAANKQKYFDRWDETEFVEGAASGAVAEYIRDRDANRHYVEINPDEDIRRPGLVAHELSHAASWDYNLGKEAQKYLGKGKQSYLQSPDEAYGNLQELRQVLGLKPHQRNLTPEQVQELQDQLGSEDQQNYINNFGIENVTKALNNVAEVENSPEGRENNLKSFYAKKPDSALARLKDRYS